MKDTTPISDVAQNITSNPYPLLSQIDTPSDLRKLPVDSLPEVAQEIRKLIIDTLSDNPGHFGSSMGAVDFIVALHYVFDTPHDRIVWDVGHQAYAHKILTGRRALFHTNRKLGGLSGFPSPTESEYDTFTAGHASNSVSAALGMAVASEMRKDFGPRNVIAVIGDASISGGLAFEGLNNASNTPNNLLIILNDNDMSIDSNVGSLHSYLSRLHTSKGYNKVRFKLYKLMRRLHLVSDRGRGFIMRFNNSLKSLIFKQQNIFEGLNIRYFGPYDGHDIPQIVKVLNDIKDIKGPRILHLKTTKGKGWNAAEKNPVLWHAPGKFDVETGDIIVSNASSVKKRFQDVFGDAITDLARQNTLIVGITAAMPTGTSISTMRREFPNRVFDVGISEGHAVTFAAGLAKEGLRPYVAIYSSFLQRAFDNIIHDVALQQLPVVFCIDRAGIVGEDGMTHHGLLDLSYMASVPGMIVAAPRNAIWLRNLLYTSQFVEQPMSIRYPRGHTHIDAEEPPMTKVPLGKGIKLTEGEHLNIISIGTMAANVEEAIRKANREGITVNHYDAVFLQPFDQSIIEEIADSGLPVITVEDAYIKGGLYSTVLERLSAQHSRLPVVPMGVQPGTIVQHGTVKELYKIHHLDSESIYQQIIQHAKK